jgi:hypothetical protein
MGGRRPSFRTCVAAVLAIAVAATFAVVTAPGTALAAGSARRKCAPIWFATKIGEVCVVADGKGHVNAVADRYVGGTTDVQLIECGHGGCANEPGGAGEWSREAKCTSPNRKRTFTPLLSDRAPHHYYFAKAYIIWPGHGTTSQVVTATI